MRYSSENKCSRGNSTRIHRPANIVEILKRALGRGAAWACFALVAAGQSAMADVLVDIAASNGVVKPGESSVIEVT
ncbi:MAG: hypothetical protein AB8G18_18750, partial [Gammaproteobacteria bacterium]